MIKIGQTNELSVGKTVDFGVYLTDGSGTEILLPARYVPQGTADGDRIEVFIYRDNEGRLIATTEKPYASVGEFAYLQVKQVNKVGAFLDWGLMKELLVPFSEQKARMREGGIYLVYVYLDHTTQRIVASAKVEKFLGNVVPHYGNGQRVNALITEHIEGLGYRCIVDNLHRGMIYDSDLSVPLVLEQTVSAFVRHVRDDGKIDLTVAGNTRLRVSGLAGHIMKMLESDPDALLGLGDHSDPEEIRAILGCSKKDFKKAIGQLYREHAVSLSDDGIRKAR